ncbi:MAG TPA: dTDP-4-dehydrorhamnose reductase [Sphingomonadaceae bacterium]|nr:dTDP-4-dehydrorhamnose reductase [Sphingomonadaceae bacterium]
MARPAILVTGGTGQVGTGIARANRGRFDLALPTRAELDLASPDRIAAMIGARDWTAVINCAAYTAVDRAEEDRETAFAINATAAAALAEAAAKRDIPFLHVSTDYVFDGAKAAPYVEQDPVAPLGVYGASKETGERVVRAAHPRALILRTAWVVSPWGHNFVKTMRRLGRERDLLRVVDDQHGCPTGAIDIAETLLTLAGRLIADDATPTGTYHFVNAGEASWYDLARAIFEFEAKAGRPVPRLEPIPTSAYPTPARRPANSRLSTAKIAANHGVVPRNWRAMLDELLAALEEQDA